MRLPLFAMSEIGRGTILSRKTLFKRVEGTFSVVFKRSAGFVCSVRSFASMTAAIKVVLEMG